MNSKPDIEAEILLSTCPHDCPSTCALEVERLDAHTIGRVRGAKANDYTLGVVCEKVARYAERIHHPGRLLHPMRRRGEKGSGDFERITWEQALDEVAGALLKAEQAHGSEAVWPYYYAGTMGLVMRDGINRLRHAKRYSGEYTTICSTLSGAGFTAGTGKLRGPDPREMAKSDLIVIWGTNPVHTQVNVMTHVMTARKERGAKIVAVDDYNNATMKKADLALCLKPGTDGALAAAVMHVLFRDGHADRDYMREFADLPDELEAYLKEKTPDWASTITGLSVEQIETFAGLIGTTPRTYLRLGYGFTRSRNGAFNMHAASCIATVTGAWRHEGGGAFHNNGGIYHINKTMIEGLDVIDPDIRLLDQSRIGAVLTGDPCDLGGGPPVTALFIQNTNPLNVAPEQKKVRAGFAREDLFVCVHEQFMTETAQMADVVLPATMFLEHDDVYLGGGHQYISLGLKVIEPAGECRSNHDVVCALAGRLGASHPGFEMTQAGLIDWTLRNSGWGNLEDLRETNWIDCQPEFDKAHFLRGFNFPDGKFRFSPDWPNVKFPNAGPMGPVGTIPKFPDYWEVIETADEAHPFRLATSPARTFLNSSFAETPSSRRREGRPEVKIHPLDAAELGIGDGVGVVLGNSRGEVRLHARLFEGVCRGVLIAEGIFPNHAHEGGAGINTLIGADQPAPFGGAAFHDTRVWVRAA